MGSSLRGGLTECRMMLRRAPFYSTLEGGPVGSSLDIVGHDILTGWVAEVGLTSSDMASLGAPQIPYVDVQP